MSELEKLILRNIVLEEVIVQISKIANINGEELTRQVEREFIKNNISLYKDSYNDNK